MTESVAGRAGLASPPVLIFASDQAQSFLLPGGEIGMTIGMLRLIETEAELACVLAHELAHLELGHASAHASLDAPAAWSDDDERSADARAAALCTAAGYNALALPHLLYRAARYFEDAPLAKRDASPDSRDPRVGRIVAALNAVREQGVSGGTVGYLAYRRFAAVLDTDMVIVSEGSPESAGKQDFFVRHVIGPNVAQAGLLMDSYEEGKQASYAWIEEQCGIAGSNTVPSNYIDAFGHCWYGCTASRSCSGICGNPGIWYELGRESGLIGGDEHDSFWQDWRNQNVGYRGADGEGSCYGVCADAIAAGALDLTAPERQWWECDTGRWLDERPEDASYTRYGETVSPHIFGDPHIVTGDGLRYDFQAAGEFMALQDVGGDLTIQVRLEPVPILGASKVTAVAARVHDDRIGVYAGDQGMVVRLNGAVRQPDAEWSTLPGGGQLQQTADAVVMRWKDGPTLRVYASDRLLDLAVDVTLREQSQFAGLLGDFDGSVHNDWRTRDGAPLALATERGEPNARGLYDVFGASWRISQAESLFDYEGLESTDTFQLLGFPQTPVHLDALEPERAAEARDSCMAAGVTASPWFEDCVLDVAVTGERQFTQSSIRAQSWSEAVPLAGGDGTSILERDFRSPGTHVLERFDAFEGERMFFYKSDVSGSLDLSNWQVVAPNGELLFSQCIGCNQPGPYTLPASGRYVSQLVVEAGEQGRISARRNRIPDPEIFEVTESANVGSDVPGPGAGNIELPGAVDVYRIRTEPGDELSIEVLARAEQLYFGQWRLQDPDGSVMFDELLPSPGLSPRKIRLDGAGEHTLTVSGGDRWPSGDDYGYGRYTLAIRIGRGEGT